MNADLVAERAALVELLNETEAQRTDLIRSFAKSTGINDQQVTAHFKRLDNYINVLGYMYRRCDDIDQALKERIPVPLVTYEDPVDVYGKTSKDLEAAALELCNALEYTRDASRDKREEVIDALLSAGLGETLVFQEILHV